MIDWASVVLGMWILFLLGLNLIVVNSEEIGEVVFKIFILVITIATVWSIASNI